MDQEFMTITLKQYKELTLAAKQLEFALDMIPNLDDVLEQFNDEGEGEDE